MSWVQILAPLRTRCVEELMNVMSDVAQSPHVGVEFCSLQDIPAETEETTNIDPVATPPCHDRTTNHGSLTQTDPSTSGHIDNLDKEWRKASRSISQ
ncbi:hypothetical protein TNCV_4351251 [Trichonephila clavipes]|nr:hypothetical protein TNCV_4351251 [Trichonephila clavipes]